MHHKFVVLDFDTDDARVYLGSYNFSEAADFDNGENMSLVVLPKMATRGVVKSAVEKKRVRELIGEYQVKGFCATCGYRLNGWRVILGGKRTTYQHGGRMPKVLS